MFEKMILKSIKPCKKCAYKLGLIKTFANPCPHCKINKYQTFKLYSNIVFRNRHIY